MKGIMRKRLIALLSMAGLAGSASHATAQVLKGSDNEKTKTERTIKGNKPAQENNAAKDQVTKKGRKAGHEQDALTVKQKVVDSSAGATRDKDGALQKTNTENAAFKKEALEHHGRGTAQMGDGSVSKAATGGGGGAGKAKLSKGAAETNAATGEHIKKAVNNTAENQAGQQDAQKKLDKASPNLDKSTPK